jgi:hypothetical protein
MTFPGPNPHDGSCDSTCIPGSVRVNVPQSNDVDADLRSAASQINDIIQTDPVGDGTPTSASLRILATYPPLQDPLRQNLIILETDGLPNCNPLSAHDGCDDPAACQCTESDPNNPAANACCPPIGYQCLRTRGCLDRDGPNGTLAALDELRRRNILVFVIGFGADAAASGDVLNAMAEAGGEPRVCPGGSDAECGVGNSCNVATKKCTAEFYQAADGNELARVLDAIRGGFETPCGPFVLEDRPTDPALLSVLINGQPVAAGQGSWTYAPDPLPSITFVGAVCQQLRNSTADSPVHVEFRIVQRL